MIQCAQPIKLLSLVKLQNFSQYLRSNFIIILSILQNMSQIFGSKVSIVIYVWKLGQIVYHFVSDRCVVMPCKLISRITKLYFPCYQIIVPFALLIHAKVNICANCIRAWQYLDEILPLCWDECFTIKNLNCFCNRAWNQKRSINKHLTKSCHDGE